MTDAFQQHERGIRALRAGTNGARVMEVRSAAEVAAEVRGSCPSQPLSMRPNGLHTRPRRRVS
jgi:hypothetical protein